MPLKYPAGWCLTATDDGIEAVMPKRSKAVWTDKWIDQGEKQQSCQHAFNRGVLGPIIWGEFRGFVGFFLRIKGQVLRATEPAFRSISPPSCRFRLHVSSIIMGSEEHAEEGVQQHSSIARTKNREGFRGHLYWGPAQRHRGSLTGAFQRILCLRQNIPHTFDQVGVARTHTLQKVPLNGEHLHISHGPGGHVVSCVM